MHRHSCSGFRMSFAFAAYPAAMLFWEVQVIGRDAAGLMSLLLSSRQALQNPICLGAGRRKYLHGVRVMLIGYVIHIAVSEEVGFIISGVGPHDGNSVCTLFLKYRAENPVDIIIVINMMAHLMQKHEWIADADVDRLLSEAVQTFDEADGELVQPVVVVDDLIAILVEIQPDGTGNHVRVVDEFINRRRVLDFRYQVHQVQILVNQRLPDETGRLSAGEILVVKLMRDFKLEAVDEHLAELSAGQAGIRMFWLWNLRLRYQLN